MDGDMKEVKKAEILIGKKKKNIYLGVCASAKEEWRQPYHSVQ